MSTDDPLSALQGTFFFRIVDHAFTRSTSDTVLLVLLSTNMLLKFNIRLILKQSYLQRKTGSGLVMRPPIILISEDTFSPKTYSSVLHISFLYIL